MPSLTQIRTAAVATLDAGLSGGTKVAAFSGALSVEALTSRNVPGLAVYVAALGAQNVTAADSLVFDLSATFGALVISRRGKDQTAREEDGLAVAEAVAAIVHGNVFDLAGVSPARVFALSPLDDDDLAEKGVWIWSVIWQQGFIFTSPTFPEANV